MKKFNFTATTLDIRTDEEVESVFLGDEATETALLLSVAKPDGTAYTELNDQSCACHGGVKTASLSGESLQVKLNAKGSKTLGCQEITVLLECSPEEYRQLATSLQLIFGKAFSKASKAPAAKASKPKPAPDYSKIRYLNLEGKNLKALPAHVAAMHALETVKLSRNPRLDMEAAIEILRHLPNINELSFTTTTSIPPNIGALTNLEHLSITGLTEEHTVPDSIGHLKKLRYLYIRSENKLVLPETVADLASLENLHIQATTWNLPAHFCRLTLLKHLDLEHCDLREIPACIEDLTHLESLHLYGDQPLDFSLALERIARIKNLSALRMYVNPIPPTIGLLTQLKELVINFGIPNSEAPLLLPDALWKLKQLTNLEIRGCTILHIPDDIAKLSALESLGFMESSFEQLPASIGQLKNLRELSIHSNPLLKELPDAIAGLSQLEMLLVINNPHITSITDLTGRMPHLQKVYFEE